MTFNKPALAELANESDVEQRFTFPLIVAPYPHGLGYASAEILTKSNIRRFVIGKNSDQKSYFPDYLYVVGGLPLVVIEAKTPGSNLEEAYREARLYAAELNAIHPSGSNPLTYVIATDGVRTIAGPADQAVPLHDLAYDDITPYSAKFAALVEYVGRDAVQKTYARIAARLRPPRVFKPRKLMGGTAVQEEEIGPNSFGANVSAELAHIFNPKSLEDRAAIAREGYIPSKRRDRYVDPIDKVIRASAPPSEARSRLIEDTAKPTEIVKQLRSGRTLEQQVLLLIGGAGSGKTTFIDYLKEVALPADVKQSTLWLHMNMNAAPGTAKEVYDWFRGEIVAACRRSTKEIDFDDLSILRKLFSVEINAFRKGPGRLYKDEKYDEKLGDLIQSLLDDQHKSAVAYVRYLANERGKLAVIVFDNCDKRNLEEQLLMFEVAQWVQKEFKALVILPLREETYDHHRDEAPLDTALKDLVFRIEPPAFQSVLMRRLQLALAEVSRGSTKTFKFDLPNGYTVEYAASDQAYFLTSIVRSMLEHDKHIRRLITGLSGRNLRRALEIFLEFCTSGHISEDHIYKIRHSHGGHVLPRHLVTTVLLRLSRRYYDSDASFLKNIFGADERDEHFNYFSRALILKWLHKNISSFGPSRLKGYFPVGTIWKSLSPLGVSRHAFDREIEYLAKSHCIISEDFRTSEIRDEDLVKLGPAGLVHIHLLGDVSYLAAVSEDTWFADEPTARRIAERIRRPTDHYQPATALYNAIDVVSVLGAVRDQQITASESVLAGSEFADLTDLSVANSAISALEAHLVTGPWKGSLVRYPVGSEHQGSVASLQQFGVLIELEEGIRGLAHSSSFGSGYSRATTKISYGDVVTVTVLEVRPAEGRMSLKIK